MTRKTILVLASILFISTVYLANWLVNHYGPIRVWPTALVAPAGVYVIGLAFLLRDTIQRLSGQLLALVLVALGTVLSVAVNWQLALASGCAFAVSEVVALFLFWSAGGNRGGPLRLSVAVVVASLAGAALDSYVFLSLAPTFIPGVDNVEAFFRGQFVAKLSVVVLAIPFVMLARRAYPGRVVTA